jgi:hypothetical protein
MNNKKVILHLCADIGSDSYSYQLDPSYEVIKIGKDIGVENYHPDRTIHGIIANPVCTEFSTVRGFNKKIENPSLFLLKECKRIIAQSNPEWWVIENPAKGTMKDYMGKPNYIYHPWWYGSPWTKLTALWGKFNIPKRIYYNWDNIPKNMDLYIRNGRKKPSLAFLHKSAIYKIPEFEQFIPFVHDDNGFRSLCSQGFAKEFKKYNP